MWVSVELFVLIATAAAIAMDASVFGVSWEEEAAAHQAARVESAATIFASVFSADGAQLISGALPSQRRRLSLLFSLRRLRVYECRALSLPSCRSAARRSPPTHTPTWSQVPARGV